MMNDILIALFCVVVILAVVFELSTALVIGFKFITNKSLELLEKDLETAWLNDLDHRILCNFPTTKMGVSAVFDSLSFILSRYYIDTEWGYYRVPRFSKAHRLITKKYKTLKEEYYAERPKM